MSGPILLLTHTVRRIRTVLIAMGALLFAFQILLVLAAREIDRSGGFRQLAALLPSFVRDLMGPAVTAFLSFSGIVCLGYFHLAVMGSLIGLAVAIATIPAGEIETGFIDLLLARPLRRHWIITRTIVVVVFSIAALLCFMTLGTWFGLAAVAPPGAPWPSAQLVYSFAANLGLVVLSWSGVALALASVSRRRGFPGGATGVLALAAFLVDYLARLWKPLDSIAWLSPFRYFLPYDLIRHQTMPLRHAVVLCGIAAAGFLAAYAGFARRDISR